MNLFAPLNVKCCDAIGLSHINTILKAGIIGSISTNTVFLEMYMVKTVTVCVLLLSNVNARE